MKSWLGRRIHFMDTNFLAAPTAVVRPGAAEGELLASLSGPPGATLYYTTDGSDPRAAGGAIAPSANVYAAPVPLGATGSIRARSRNPQHRNLTGPNNPPLTSPWSGPIEVRRGTLPDSATRSLVFSEVHAHPAPPSTEEAAGNPLRVASDFEFLELANFGTEAVDLGDLRLIDGVRFSFSTSGIPVLAPSARLVLVRNRGAFAQRYGAAVGIAGEYQGGLNADGETLRVVDGLGRTVASAAYRTESHPAADGLGFSLVLQNEVGNGTNGARVVREEDWRVGREIGGSPGIPDAGPASFPNVVVHEALTHTDPPMLDGIELRNLGTELADVGGWWLTDDREQPFKYRIPGGTILPPGGYLWFDEDDLSASPGTGGAFQLDSTGDAVWLFSADGSGRLTGYVHGFDFGAAANGVTFGREVDCTGRESFLAQAAPTPGAPNAGADKAPVQISEVHYRPPDIRVGGDAWNDSALEFVEIANVSNAAVDLFDASHPTNTWHLKDAVSYVFPENMTVPPGGTVVIVNFDPTSNPQAVARFRTVYGVEPSVSLVGPYSGSLPNGRGKIELARPDKPQQAPDPDAGQVPYIVVDRVNYLDRAPWPPWADGTGRSLSRVGWGRVDPGARSWVAAVPSPGVVMGAGGDSDQDGMPDGWEADACLDPNDAADAGLDRDGDGALNRDEFTARTDPSNPADVLGWTGTGVDESGRLHFVFQAKAGLAYGVEVSDALAPGGWRQFENVVAGGATRTVEVQDAVGPGARYYRLVVVEAR